MLDITVPYGKSQDRLGTGFPGMSAPGMQEFSQSQVDLIGTDIFGNGPTISQLAGSSTPFIDALQPELADKLKSTGGLNDMGGSSVSESVGGGIGWAEELLQRAAVIILGFIFVAVGLSMFNGGSKLIATVTAPVKATAKTAGHAVKAAADNTA